MNCLPPQLPQLPQQAQPHDDRTRTQPQTRRHRPYVQRANEDIAHHAGCSSHKCVSTMVGKRARVGGGEGEVPHPRDWKQHREDKSGRTVRHIAASCTDFGKEVEAGELSTSGGLAFDARVWPERTRRLRRLAWSAVCAHTRLGTASAAAGLIEDLVFSVGELLPSTASLVVHDTAELRAAVDEEYGAKAIELDAVGTFELTEALVIRRAVRLVSGGGGRARLVGMAWNWEAGGGSHTVRVAADGVVLEKLAVEAHTDGFGEQQVAVYVGESGVRTVTGAAMLRDCDMTGGVHVIGSAELHYCEVHDSKADGLAVTGEGAAVLLVSTSIVRCVECGVFAKNFGVVRLEGQSNRVDVCPSGLYAVENGGQIEGLAPNQLVMQY